MRFYPDLPGFDIGLPKFVRRRRRGRPVKEGFWGRLKKWFR